ncbi:hypothetical protein GCM10027052_04190 [Parafrigoribacterium mesophilum]|uniref:hypothetical protein n=1 Tax=Parafrigoribacterium mesophilum TaxID=433646 RepID=UPI0031FCE08E
MSDTTADGEPAHDVTPGQPAATQAVAAPIAAPTPPPVPKSKLAQAALFLGIVAAVCAMIPVLNAAAVVAGLGAIVCGGFALKRKTAHRRRSIAGLSLGAVALIIAMVVSSASAGGNTTAESAVQQSGASATQPSETPAATSESPKPTPTEASPTEEAAPPAPVVPADKVYQGSGDSVVAVELPDGADQVSVATISHTGAHNFAVWSLDSNMEQHDLMVNQIGTYQGTVLFNLQSSNTTSLQVTATGPWTITLRSIKSLRTFEGAAATGTGDDVLIYLGKPGAATISHDGQHNFAVWSYGDRSDLVVNEIGAYNGTVRWGTGPSVVAVSADGNWSIKVG